MPISPRRIFNGLEVLLPSSGGAYATNCQSENKKWAAKRARLPREIRLTPSLPSRFASGTLVDCFVGLARRVGGIHSIGPRWTRGIVEGISARDGTSTESLPLLNDFLAPSRLSLSHARCNLCGRYGAVLRAGLGVRSRLRASIDMEYIAAGIIALGLAAYLFYALLRPERF